MKSIQHLACVALTIAALVAACNGSLQQTCVTGQTNACAGANGCSGTQTCAENGTFNACVCGGDDGGVPLDASNDVAQPVDASIDTPMVVDATPDASPCTATPPSTDAGTGDISHPTPTTTMVAKGYTIRLELGGFAGYGVADDKCDILYTSDSASWTFTVPSTPIVSATLAVSLVAADGLGTPASDFTYDLWSGGCEFTTPSPLPHGMPFASQFTNWVEVDEPAYPTPSSTFTVTIFNTSNATPTDWIGVDWMELRVLTQ